MSAPRKAPEELAVCDLGHVLRTLQSRRLPTTSEGAIHDAIKRLFTEAQIDHIHEHPLNRTNRPDFVIQTMPDAQTVTAIEIKLRRSSDAAIMRQCIRYALTGKINALILIVGRHFQFTGSYIEGPDNTRIPFHIIRPAL